MWWDDDFDLANIEAAKGNSFLAFDYYQSAAIKGDARAQFRLGIIYIAGDGIPVDNEKGKSWLYQAARQGMQEAQHSLGLYYASENSFEEALHWLEKSVANGNFDAQEDILAVTKEMLAFNEEEAKYYADIEESMEPLIEEMLNNPSFKFQHEKEPYCSSQKKKKKKKKRKTHSKKTDTSSSTSKTEDSRLLIHCPVCDAALRLPNISYPNKGKSTCKKCSSRLLIRLSKNNTVTVSIIEANKSEEITTRSEALEVLGVSQDADAKAIKSAYKKKMSEYHPDKVATLGERLRKLAEQESKRINTAYAFLLNEILK
jgi:DnaJ-class molecular chaperone